MLKEHGDICIHSVPVVKVPMRDSTDTVTCKQAEALGTGQIQNPELCTGWRLKTCSIGHTNNQQSTRGSVGLR